MPDTVHAAAPDSAGLLARYTPPGDAYDELLAAPARTPRPHWRPFLETLDRLGSEELAARWEGGRRIIGEHGITYNVHGDPQGLNRPWELDLVPFLLPADEWRHIEDGLKQRAQLFNLILNDLYAGPQRLIRDGFIPPTLVYANPGFLRPCHGIRPPGGRFVHLHAVDLARTPDGQWRVLADRTQAPAGPGYALENRMVLSRILPEEFQDSRVERLGPFVAFLRHTLQHLAPPDRPQPSVVVLTPGPLNETYFEHAYLARHLGFTLVEGGDLTVRDRRIFLKTLEGLQPVDTLFRRMDELDCDPLELRPDSLLGVAGLVEATRAGTVAIANSLGSGLLQSPAFLPFLPAIARQLLGEDLALPSVATWWCGQSRERQYVADHLDQLLLRRAFGSKAAEAQLGSELTAAERSACLERLQRAPEDFVAQEEIRPSTAPVWARGALEPQPVVLRTYVAAGPDGVVVMPGGLARVPTGEGGILRSMRRGGGSKDVWILSDRPIPHSSTLAPPSAATGPDHASRGLPSRTADNLFWLGRYVERLEQRVRLLRHVLGRLADEDQPGTSASLAALAALLSQLEPLPAAASEDAVRAPLQTRVLQFVHDPRQVGSAAELLERIRFLAATARDRFSADTWRILNRLRLETQPRPGRIPLAHTAAALNTLIADLAAFSGMGMENMTRGHGWRFLDVGRRIERGVQLANLLHAALADPRHTPALLDPLLAIADSAMTYRRLHFTQPSLPGVLALLLADETNPRSLAFQLDALTTHASRLPGAADPASQPEAFTRLPTLQTRIRAGDWAQLGQPALAAWLKATGEALAEVSDQLGSHYFSHTLLRPGAPALPRTPSPDVAAS